MAQCPLCGYELEREPHDVFETDGKIYSCPNCGRFELTFVTRTNLRNLLTGNPTAAAILSHALRKMSSGSERWPKLTWGLVESILATTELPSPTEQVENLLLWMADNSTFGEPADGVPQTHSAIVGNSKPEGLAAAAEALIRRGYAEGEIRSGVGFICRLTLEGWQAAEELKRGGKRGRAFTFESSEGSRVFCFRCLAAHGFRRTVCCAARCWTGAVTGGSAQDAS